jgi:hypothetical protein
VRNANGIAYHSPMSTHAAPVAVQIGALDPGSSREVAT